MTEINLSQLYISMLEYSIYSAIILIEFLDIIENLQLNSFLFFFSQIKNLN